MTGLLLTTLFASSAFVAGLVIATNLRRYLPAFAANRQALRDCAGTRDFVYSIRTVEVRPLGARIYRPDFTAAKPVQPLRVAA